jgi:hypothetical protein
VLVGCQKLMVSFFHSADARQGPPSPNVLPKQVNLWN